MSNHQTPHRVVFSAYPGVGLLDIAGAQSVFWSAGRAMEAQGALGYHCVIASIEGGLVETAEGLYIDTLAVASIADIADSPPGIDTLIVPGSPDILPALSANECLIQWIASPQLALRRVASICSGTFLLAAAGLLDGKWVTTHWSMCDTLKSRHRSLRVDRDAVFIQQGNVWTSGGVTSGMDLALALVEADCGREVAMQVARELLVVLKRPGGQPQYSELLCAQSNPSGTFDELHLWLASNIGQNDLSVGHLAQQVHMSARNFSRVYKRVTGRTPAKTIELFRLGAARRMLEDSDRNIDQVASACGFGDEERMRVTFHRHLGLSPRDYRVRHLAGSR
jgi:transcriptional regulator GlxA family with amidase domain